MRKGELDLRHINLGETPIVAFQAKRDALAYAREHGHTLNHVMPARNRFWQFWTIARFYDAEQYDFALTGGGETRLKVQSVIQARLAGRK